MQKQKLTPYQQKELSDFITMKETPGPAVRRAQAVLLLDQQTPLPASAQLTGFSKEHLFRLRREYLAHGLVAFKDKRRGDPKPLLAKQQQ